MISSLNNFAARRTYKYVLFACAHYTITYSIFPERIQNMKKVKQILAIIGVIILAGLYVSTIVCAVSASENFMNMLMTSIYASVIIPVLIWAYSFIYKLIKKDSEEKILQSIKKSAPEQNFLSGADSAFILFILLCSQLSPCFLYPL